MRLQLALNVDNLEEAIDFYTKMFNTEPLKVKPGYANWAIVDPPLKLVIFEKGGEHGTINHLFAELFKQDAGISIIHVPYNGGAPAMTAVMGGQVDMMFQNLVEALPHIKSGRVKPIAIASLKRSSVLPEVPTLDESGFKGYESALWYGLVAATGTPAEAIKTVNEAMKQIQQSSAIRERLIAMGLESVYMTPDELAGHIKREIEKWSGVVRAAGIKPD